MLTYCSNIHPGESWAETFVNLRTHLLAVKGAVSPDSPFPIGLRLSYDAIRELETDGVSHFVDWLGDNDCFVPTINGFPYGSFHGVPVKEKVYQPDWRDRKRADYTLRLVRLLDALLPATLTGSISTVPVAFGKELSPDDFSLVRGNILHVLEHLDGVRQRGGREIVLSLEPEPSCFIETTGELVRFIERLALPHGLRSLLGVCFDCCHHAVEFEPPVDSLALLGSAGIRIGKVQVSSALRFVEPAPELLSRFNEPVYLHQAVVRRSDGALCRYRDLPEALRDHSAGAGDEWRVHFHVPLFIAGTGSYSTTRDFIEAALPLIPTGTLLEVETYTWSVLPPELQAGTVTESIIRELQWLKSRVP